MPKYWMISDRDIVLGADGKQTGYGNRQAKLTYWTSDVGPLDVASNWTNKTAAEFKDLLIQAAGQFPLLAPGDNENQKHVAFFVHGYNNGWDDAARRYEGIVSSMFDGVDSLGICVSFDWPSYGSVLDYLPDRDHAKQCAFDLTAVMSEVYDWLLLMQKKAAANPLDACRAKVSFIAHSMGNFLLQKAAKATWTRKNQPLLASLMNQVVMVAADVDNTLFDPGSPGTSDGDALANLSYRITALYSGRDAVLGASAGLKHFGERRLGRSGLSNSPPLGKSNVWDVDCSAFFPKATNGLKVHSAYFETDGTMLLMRNILMGIDRGVLQTLRFTVGKAWP